MSNQDVPERKCILRYCLTLSITAAEDTTTLATSSFGSVEDTVHAVPMYPTGHHQGGNMKGEKPMM